MILALGAAAIGGFFMSALFNGKLIIRDIINAPIAGGIAIGASSLFITNPCYAVVVGFSAGFIQVFIQNAVEKPLVQKRGINELLSFSLFGLQGLIGSGFAAGWRAIVGGYSDKVAIDKIILNQSQPIYQFVIGLISAAIGLGIGLIAGLLIYFVTRHQTYEHYTDRTYWILNDKIRQKEDDKVE